MSNSFLQSNQWSKCLYNKIDIIYIKYFENSQTYDSFKTFEALAVKTIPIIQRLGVWQKAHEDLPVVVIDDFSEINPENLDRWWNKLSPQLGDVMNKLKIDYWWNKVNG